MILFWLSIAATGVGLWLYLWLGRGGFWRIVGMSDHEPVSPEGSSWPALSVIIPARDEAALLPQTLPTVLASDYPGPLQVYLVDDHSSDGTGRLAREIARDMGREGQLTVLTANPLPPGWTGKIWALEQGRLAAEEQSAPFLLFTGADVVWPRDGLRRLVGRAERDGLDLASLLVRLRTETSWERLLMPAFVYFFALRYPFSRVNDPRSRTAAAAGGCLLLRREALAAGGGLSAIAGERIGDCALARRIKRTGWPQGGRIWLGPGVRTRSLRAYGDLPGIWENVASTVYVQLRLSPWLLAAATCCLLAAFILPPLAAMAGAARLAVEPSLPAAWYTAAAGFAAWLLMARTYLPLARLFGLSSWSGFLLPGSALLYLLMTIDSARRFGSNRDTGQDRGNDSAGPGDSRESAAIPGSR